eukprot:gene5308-65096_t
MPGGDAAFRSFRIRCTGASAAQCSYFHVNGFEVYGTLYPAG